MKKSSLFLLLMLFVLFLSSGCLNSGGQTIILWTDRPEIAAYVEQFNAENHDFRIELEFRESPEQAVTNSITLPDIVIGKYLTNSQAIKIFSSLDYLFKKERLSRKAFYPELLNLGQLEGKQVLLPIAFNLPILMFKSGKIGVDTFFLSPEIIESESIAFNEQSDKSFQQQGFGLLWEPEMLYLVTRLFETRFQETGFGELIWREEGLQNSINYFDKWSANINGGKEKEREFTDKYLYDPGYKLINEGRILFYYTDIKSFFRIPGGKRDNLDFRWIAGEEGIPVMEDVLYAGIPKTSKNAKAAREFLSWFFQRETQARLLESTQFKRMRTFGISNGFSSLREINEIDLPRYYPALVGHIPPESSFSFPQPLPADWEGFKEQAVKPWLLGKVTGMGEHRELEEAIRAWLLQRPQR